MPVAQLAALGQIPVKNVVKLFVPQKYHTVLILDEEYRVSGVLTETAIWERAAVHGFTGPIKKLL